MSKLGKLVEQICLLACLYLISYQIIVFIWDHQGLVAYRKLLQVQQKMETHYEELEKHQRGLLARADQISNERSHIIIEARGLGYYQKNDKLILVNTWSQAQPAPSPGSQLMPDMKAMQAPSPSGIWLYASFLGVCFWLIIRFLYFGQTNNIPREFSLEGKFFQEKFPRVQHAKTIRNSSLRDLQKQSGNSHSQQINDNSFLDTIYDPGILATEPYFPNREDVFYRR